MEKGSGSSGGLCSEFKTLDPGPWMGAMRDGVGHCFPGAASFLPTFVHSCHKSVCADQGLDVLPDPGDTAVTSSDPDHPL